MKKYIFIIIVLLAIGGGFVYTLMDESYDYYEKAKVLYEEGKYKEAHDMLEIGLSKNKLNRKIIALKGKIYPIVQGQEKLEEAKALYEEAINLALEGRVQDAKLKLSRAYDLADDVTTSSLVYDDAQDLIRKIERDATLVLDSAPETQYRNALKLEGEGKLLRAFEALNNIEMKSEKVRRKMSDIAFRLGEIRFRELEGQVSPNEHYVRDAIYWYSQVQPFDDNYMTASQKINELKFKNTN